MYLSMGHMMWGWPLPAMLEHNHVAQGLLQLILTAIIMVINQKFFISGFKSLVKGAPNMDTLVALGSDAFFPFGDNIERAHRSGVEFIAQAGGSVRDDHVIETCDKYGIAMAFTGVRLFHH